ncbi:MAG: DUF177 domain-containing protein [Clostridia bacterium]|nr:DUF177 domain-containing protein [Clostridia bacterium]
MKIGVSSLKTGFSDELEFDFQEKWSYLGTASAKLPVVAPVRVQGKVTNTGKSMLVEGKVVTALQLTCDRCLAAYKFPLKVYLQEEYVVNSDPAQAGSRDELEAENLRLYKGEIIDLQPAVEEALTIALPMKSLCHEDCRGLCPRCGQNFNEAQCQCETETVDPRLAVLGKLLSPKEGES